MFPLIQRSQGSIHALVRSGGAFQGAARPAFNKRSDLGNFKSMTVKRPRTASTVSGTRAAAVPMTTAIRRPRTDLLQHTYTSQELAIRYGFPSVKGTSNFWIGIVELGGGWSEEDLDAYCKQLRIDTPKTDTTTLRGFDGSYTGDPKSADGEYALDMQVVAGATNGIIGMYLVNAPNTGDGIAQGLQAVANWTPPSGGMVSAVSLSWGRDEAKWAQSDIATTETALKALAAMNIPVFAASGDDGAEDNDEGNNVDYPASSPNAFGCGGTTIAANGKLETAWSYGGGGISAIFPTPSWQVASTIANISNGMRCVPDAAMDADPNSGYNIIVGGKQTTVGGTSAVAPMWASWKALTDTVAGAVLPFSAASVYQLHDLTDVIVGYNGGFSAMPGYDLCTGEGVPNENFTQAWLALNKKIDSFAFGIKNARPSSFATGAAA